MSHYNKFNKTFTAAIIRGIRAYGGLLCNMDILTMKKREYVIDRVDLPASWTNYLGLKDTVCRG